MLILFDEKALPPSTAEGYASIGGPEAQGIALAARDYYLSRGWFFALARQDPKIGRRVDCVAYDYDRNLAAAVETESSEHVFHDRIEQMKQGMMEIFPFDEVHFWAYRDAADSIAVYAFYALVLGVALHVASYVKYGESTSDMVASGEVRPQPAGFRWSRRRKLAAVAVVAIIFVSVGVGVLYPGPPLGTTLPHQTYPKLEIANSGQGMLHEPDNSTIVSVYV
ncbi:MAG: hypothetical protein JRN06_07345 [Nitrososphaerota archaeon]|nr:hypothetical protein [Nitrososphaerota archaeon]MDG7024404.1 hypothetical protein [Nitrososphaerota archaeon]